MFPDILKAGISIGFSVVFCYFSTSALEAVGHVTRKHVMSECEPDMNSKGVFA